MSRLSKFIAVITLVLFVLACNFVTQPFGNVPSRAATLQLIGTAIPIETLEALPSLAPTVEAMVTDIPGVGNVLNPQGTPVQEWKGIPIMPQATAGQEFPENNIYSFKANVTTKEVQDFYNEKLTPQGWKQPLGTTSQGDTGILFFQKENNALTITVMSSNGSTVVILTMV